MGSRRKGASIIVSTVTGIRWRREKGTRRKKYEPVNENNVTRRSKRIGERKKRSEINDGSGCFKRIMHVGRRRRMFLKHVRHALGGSLTELWRHHNSLSLSLSLFLSSPLFISFFFLPPSICHGATPVSLAIIERPTSRWIGFVCHTHVFLEYLRTYLLSWMFLRHVWRISIFVSVLKEILFLAVSLFETWRDQRHVYEDWSLDRLKNEVLVVLDRSLTIELRIFVVCALGKF